MNWHTLTSEEQLEQVKLASNTKPQLLFKHSTRCSISSMALNRLNREADFPNVDFHLLDLITYRNVSKKIADDFEVKHESPQILLIKNGLCIYDESHGGINMQEIIEQAALAI
ncbi:MAG: bacillithiol system redox-active protein YtxJ [Chitinophagaceae bacterium]|nr:bacillithiol system redox-active protein YtxJ [Chitinophagaceae bacterium]